MHISINTEEGLSDLDRQILAVLAGDAKAPAATTPAKAATPAKKTAAAPAKAKAEPEPEPEDDDTDAGSDDSDGPTLQDAKGAAGVLVSSGEAAKVKAALTKVGAKKVSEIAENKIAAFIAALEA